MAKDKGKEFIGPKGICVCGHTGSGKNSDHASSIPYDDPGNDKCTKKGCDCQYFRWMRATRKYQNFLTLMK